MTFEIVFDDARRMADLFKSLSEFFDDITMHIAEEGIRIKAIDPSRVVLVEAFLPESLFAKYAVEGKHKVGIDLRRFSKVLNLANSHDSLLLRDNNGQIVVGLLGDEKIYFHLPTNAEADEIDVDIPQLAWTAKVIVLAGGLKRALRAASVIDDTTNHGVRFRATNDLFAVERIAETAKMGATMTLEDPSLLDLDVQEPTKSYYGLTYMMPIVKRLDDSAEVIIKFGNTMPVLLKYALKDEGQVKFMIAPMVEEG